MLERLSTSDAVWVAAISLVAMVVTTCFACWMLVRLPADYFHGSRRTELPTGHPAVRLTLRVLKNLGGLVAVVVGVVLSIPGVPGPGLLTIFAGLMLLEFPGKYALERRVIRTPWIRSSVDQLRRRFGRPPFEL